MGVCNLTIGSLFNGISGWILAGQKYGVETLWESEVDKFCEAVTKHHFPDVVQLGDITKLDGAKLWPVDIICAGSPCQDLSVAGKQEGLKGERSGLFRDAIRLVRDMRRASGGKYPRFFVWENVPGAFSSNRGNDFRAVLEEITEAEIPMPTDNKWADAGMVEWDGGSLAWRVLDAQYWGVPQRRRRIFLVADFGSDRAGEILLESEGLHGNITESGEAREGTAAGTESSIGGASGDCLTPWDCQAKRIYKDDGVFPCLQSTESNGEKPGSVYIPDKARSLTPMTSVDSASGFKYRQDVKGNVESWRQTKTVRRLTPLEAERLQGLPDNFTLIDDKTCSDTARYKALGNGMAQPVADYVIKRIVEVTT